MDRRKFLTSVGASVAAPAVANSLQAQTEKPKRSGKSKPPNVILMICDDLGYGDLACYGSNLSTPNLDALALEGTRFTHHDSAHPLCSASRAALLTGRYAPRSNVPNVYMPQDTGGMDLDVSTLANVLKGVGYRTMCIGKWHLGHTKDYLPTQRGFDAYYGVPYSVDMSPLPLMHNTEILEEPATLDTLTPRYTEQAIQFIEADDEKPFFLYFAQSYPHIPIHASSRFRGKSKQGIFGDAVEEIDWSMGQILRTLERHGLEEDTLILFTSDHGPWFQGSPGELRGRKGSMFEGGVRVPFIASWKETIPAGRVVAEWTSHLDVLPTVASFCSAPLPEKPLDGVNASRLFAGHEEKLERDVILYIDGWDLQCARLGDWKLRIAQYNIPWFYRPPPEGRHNFKLMKPELYNVATDPMESYDVADGNPKIVEKILAQVEKQLPTFTAKMSAAYAEMENRPSNPRTPTGAPARP